MSEAATQTDNQVAEEQSATVADENVSNGGEGHSQAGQEGQEQKATEATSAPESYEFKAPEGVDLDQNLVESFTPIAKELGLNQEQAQKLVDLYAGNLGGMTDKLVEKQLEAHNAEVEKWAEQTKSDPDIGGDAFKENVSIAQKAIARFGSPELSEFLNVSGLGNHPVIVKTFLNIGRAISEDDGGAGLIANQGGTRDTASVLFGKQE